MLKEFEEKSLFSLLIWFIMRQWGLKGQDIKRSKVVHCTHLTRKSPNLWRPKCEDFLNGLIYPKAAAVTDFPPKSANNKVAILNFEISDNLCLRIFLEYTTKLGNLRHILCCSH